MKVVLVTGGTRGIGLGIARAFVSNGDKVVVNCRKYKGKMKEIQLTGYVADLSDFAACREMMIEIEKTHGGVDVLVNNAGASYFGLLTDMKVEEISDIVNANLMTAIYATHCAVPYMVRKKAGCIINISSVWGERGASCEAVYSAAKAGVIGFTKAMAKELAPSGIRVNAISCGAFETRMNDRLSDEEKSAFAENIPLGRFGEVQEVGDLAVFLASEKAAYMTGQVVGLDGGLGA